MSKPRNWYEMTDEQRRAWQKQENERLDMEYERDQAARDAARNARAADQAKRELAAARASMEDERDEYRNEVEQLREDRDELQAEIVLLKHRIQENVHDLTFLWSNPASPPTVEHIRGVIALFAAILSDPP